jgi:acetate kinase
MRILVVNAGSSSLKLSLLGAGDALAANASLPVSRGQFEPAAVAAELARLGADSADAVGHRIVHGGRQFTGPVLIDAAVRQKLDDLTDLAPLHQPKSLAGVDAVSRVLPRLPAVACFDTAFHARMPAAAFTYALPPEWRKRWELRRYGFHGLSHAYATHRAGELLGQVPARLVVCHLGSGASLAAVASGRSVDTTMGFTPLEGLVMATRSGTVDPGLVLWLAEHAGTPPAELAATLEHRSGLLGLAGTPDMREILARADAGDDAAALALEVYLHRLRAGVASMAAALGGLDTLVFTGGVGENSAPVRAGAAAGLGFLGVRVDAGRNAAARGDTDITGPGSAVRVLVVAAREDLEVARQVRAALQVLCRTAPRGQSLADGITAGPLVPRRQAGRTGEPGRSPLPVPAASLSTGIRKRLGEEASAMSARVSDVMTKRVMAVHPAASFKEIAARLREYRVSAFPVIDEAGKVIGVVSEADLIAKEALEAGYESQPGPLSGLLHRHELEKARGVTAAALMTTPAVTVSPYDLISHAAHLMYDRRVKRLPVVDDDGRLVGIVSRTDLLSVYGRPDEDIRRDVTEKIILKEFLADPSSFTVTVKDGIVTLAGTPETPSVGYDIVYAVRHLEGVVSVRDRLSYPATGGVYTPGPLF